MSDDRSRDPFQPAARDPFQPAPRDDRTSAYPAPPQSPIAPLAPVEPPVRAKRGSGMLVNALLGVALVVAIGGVAFAAGRVSAPAAAAATRTGFGGVGPAASGAPGGFNGGIGGAGGGASLQGTVTAVSADSITLQLTSGQSITIPTDAQTTWHERQAATASDVTTGSTVIVQLQGGGRGTQNGGQGGPTASGAPARTLGPATTVTLVPAGS